MRAIIRQIFSPDLDLATEQVEDSTNFGILIQLLVGPAGGQGEESFDVMVCTPAWMEEKVREQGPLIGRHYMLVTAFDAEQIESYLRRQIGGLEADNWQALAKKIGRIGRWEFEDYVG